MGSSTDYYENVVKLKTLELRDAQIKRHTLEALKRRLTIFAFLWFVVGISSTGFTLNYLLTSGKLPVILAWVVTLLYLASALSLRAILPARSEAKYELNSATRIESGLKNAVDFYSGILSGHVSLNVQSFNFPKSGA